MATLTSLDTANAMADVIASRYSQLNTELVDLNHMRRERMTLHFAKMQTLGNDYIYLDNLDGESKISCPESLALKLCDRNYGIGGDGIVFIERSNHYDAKIRIFNRDGSEGKVAGNPLRCVAKYLYDKGIVDDTDMTIDTWSGPRTAHAILAGGEVGSVTVDMGDYTLTPAELPTTLSEDQMINGSITVGNNECKMTCVGIGNPHAVVFVGNVDAVDVPGDGARIENLPLFPERTNVEFVRVVNRTTVKMRVWERGNGETLACGSGACAAAVAAVINGYCDTDKDITVKLRGGDLLVRVSGNHVSLTGDAKMVFEGTTVI